MDIQMPILNGWEATKLIRGYKDEDTLLSQLALDSATISRNMSTISTLGRKSSPTPGSPDGTITSTGPVNDSLISLPLTLSRQPQMGRRRASSISGPRPRSRTPTLQRDGGHDTPESIGSRILAENRLVPIIAITDNASQEQKEKYVNAGMNEVLAKPLTPGTIQAIFGKYLTTQEHRQMVEDTLIARRASVAPASRKDSSNSAPSASTVQGLDLASPIPPPDTVIEKDGKPCLVLRSGTVVAGTSDQILEAVLDPRKGGGVAFQRTFLLTFRSFLQPPAFLTWLQGKFNRQLPKHPTPDQIREYAMTRGQDQQNVITLLHLWIEFKWNDFNDDITLRESLEKFLDQIRRANYVEQATELERTIEKVSRKYKSRQDQMATLMDPSNLIPRTPTESLLTADVDEEKLAQQLCLYNSMLFRHIPPIDFLNMIWKKPSPSLTFFIQRYDKESYWVATEICSRKDLKARVQMIKKFIGVARQSLEYQNFFSVFAIMSGFNLTPVQRLKKTWEALSDAKKKTMTELEQVTDVSRNFKNYRDRLENAKPPMIPFLPIFIKDLTFMNDGNESIIQGMINFDKLRLMGECVRGITALASLEYKFWNFDPDMQEYLTNPPLELNINKLTQMSLECEPRATD
ncbi:hypothetical protein HDV00_001673 [Rhizophlyctis rosea]|nr:hypothetical protein HDV00_001673 [Rhizophlyctis rosea]